MNSGLCFKHGLPVPLPVDGKLGEGSRISRVKVADAVQGMGFSRVIGVGADIGFGGDIANRIVGNGGGDGAGEAGGGFGVGRQTEHASGRVKLAGGG